MLRVVFTWLLLSLASSPAQAQAPYDYHVYIDSDLRTSTGCTVSGGGQSFAGADYRLSATATGNPPMVTARALSTCVGGSFGPGSVLPAGYPVGLNNGVAVPGGFADVIELAVPRNLLPGVEPQVRVGVAALSASGSIDVLYTSKGVVGGPPMIVGYPASIPTLGFFGALLLALALAVLSWRALRRKRLLAQLLMVGALFSGALAAWAANFIADGQVGDWTGASPIGSDPLGDPVPNLAATDIVAFFGADENRTLYFRVDVVDAENRPPVAVDDAYTTLEDTSLVVAAPGVLGNDSDPDGNPISAQGVSGPTRGTLVLNANGGFTYTPNANANGSDSFTYNAHDGQVPSLTPATVTITITPVNDPPVFTAGPNQTVLEDAGAQTVNPWATAIDDGDPEVVQTLAFIITNNSNPTLFSAGPAVSPTGVLTYTPAANANGSATITLRLEDNGSNTPPNSNTSATQSFTITVTAVNDAPTFTASNPPAVNEDAGPQTIAAWASFNPGPPDEAGQTVLGYQVSAISNGALFSAPPTVASNGTLSYTPAANANGTSTFTVRVQDSGGTANGGVDLSAPQTFTITVNAVNDPPVNSVPGPQFTADTTPLVFSTANTNALSVADLDADAGIVQMSFGTGAPANGTLSLANPGGVLATLTGNGSEQVIATGTLAALNAALNGPSGGLTYTPAAGTSAARTITVIANDQGNTGSGGALIDTDTITVNVDQAPNVTASNPAQGATSVPLAGVVTLTFNEPVNFTGVSFTYTCNAGAVTVNFNTAGNGSNTATLTPTSNLPVNAPCVVTALAAGVTDVDSNDPPNPMAANFVLNFVSVNDTPPQVTATLPASAATVAAGPQVQVSFTETVNAAAGAATIACLPSGAGSVFPAAPATAMAIGVGAGSPAQTGQPGDTCTVTVESTLVTDADAIDPPNELDGSGDGDSNDGDADDFVFSYTIDSAPTVTTVSPANGATGVATTSTLTVNFSEPVNVALGGVALNCGGPVGFVAGVLPAANVSTLTLTPSSALPTGTLCNASVIAANVADADSLDPPDLMAANFNWSFTTDFPPRVTSSTPAAAATVPTTQTLTLNFSEAVNIAAGGLTLDCGAPVAFAPALPLGNVSSVTLTPTGGLPAGSSCTLTAVAAGIGDVDAGDPPDLLDGNGDGISGDNFTLVFTVDAAPAVTTTVPANGATHANPAGNITIHFSEPVAFGPGSFTLQCPSGTPVAFSVSGSPGSVATLDPAGNLPVNVVCTVTVLAGGIADSDAIDPPDGMAANHVFSFTPANTPPVLTAGATLNYAENQAATAIDTTITVSDAEQANLASASAQITANYQNGADELACPGACGGLTANFVAASGTLNLVGSASLATYQAALRSLTYRSTSENPSTAPRTVTWIGNDGIDPSPPVTSTINVSASNDPPVLTAGATLNYTEGDPATAIGAVTVTDPDDSNLESATVTISANFQGGADVLACGACGGLTVGYAAPVLTITGSAPLATYQAALSSLTYQNTSDAPSSLARTISYVGNDGDNNSLAVTSTVNVTQVNDAPVNSVPGAQSTNEDTSLAFSVGNANLVSIADADVGGASLQVQLAVSNGTLTLNGIAGLAFSVGDGTADAAMTFTGTLTNINNALSVLTYAPTANYFGPAQLSITSNDQGNTGSGGALSDSDTVAITVNAVNDPPVATADSFDTIGNTELRVDLAAGTTPNIATTTGSGTGVRHNDSDPVENDPFNVSGIVGCADVSAPFDCTLPSGSLLSMNANGTFRFRPSPTLATGAPTNDSFTYTITDVPAVGTAASANGTVTIRAFDKVWYVQQGAAGNGRSDNPLPSFTGIALGDNSDSDVAGDIIFVRTGGASLNSSIVLEANQRLLGEGVALTTDRDLNGVTATITLVPAGTHPLVSSNTTSTVQVGNAIPVEIRGLALGSGNGAAISLGGAAAPYTGSPTLAIANNRFTGATGDGVQVNTAATSLLTLAITDNTWLTSGTHGNNAVDVVNNSATADSLRLDFSRNIDLHAVAAAVLINGGTPARTTIFGFAGNHVHGNSGVNGLVVTNLLFDATPGGAVQQVDGDTLVVGQAGNGVGGFAATFGTVSGNLRFDDMDLFGVGGLSVGGSGSMTFAVADPGSGGSSSIDSSNDFAVLASTVSLDLRLATLTSASAGSSNVSLTSVSGQFGAAAGSITKTAGASAAFAIGTSSVTSHYAGTLTTSGGVPGVNLTGNSGTLSFSGTLTIASGASTGFNATGGGTVSASAAGSTISGSGVGVNVNGSTIGAADLVFRSISSSGAANVGIALVNTGNLGGLVVTGSGTPGSGGTIANKTGADGSTTAGIGIYLENTGDVSLGWMQLNDHQNFAILGRNVRNFSMDRSIVNGANGNSIAVIPREGSVVFEGLSGNNTISHSTIAGGHEDNLRVENTTPTILAGLTLSGSGGAASSCRILDNSTGTGNIGVRVAGFNAAVMSVTIDGCLFRGNRTDAINIDAANTASVTSAVRNNFILGGSGGSNQGNLGINLTSGASGVHTTTVSNNRVGTDGTTPAPLINTGINLFSGNSSTLVATLSGNTVRHAGTGSGHGIQVFQDLDSTLRANIDSNTVSNVALDFGLRVEAAGDPSGAGGNLQVGVSNNSVSVLATALDAIRVRSRRQAVLCADIRSNTSSAGGSGFFGLFAARSDTSTFSIEGLAAGAQSAASAETYLEGQNPDVAAAALSAVGTSFNGVAVNACSIP